MSDEETKGERRILSFSEEEDGVDRMTEFMGKILDAHQDFVPDPTSAFATYLVLMTKSMIAIRMDERRVRQNEHVRAVKELLTTLESIGIYLMGSNAKMDDQCAAECLAAISRNGARAMEAQKKIKEEMPS